MKFICYELNQKTALGLLEGEEVIPLAPVCQSLGLPEFSDMTVLIEYLSAHDREAAASLQKAASSIPTRYHREDLRLLAPLQSRRNAFCVGKNYLLHIKEVDDGLTPQTPNFFSKAVFKAIGDGEEMTGPPGATSLDYEAELTIVIGKQGKNIKKEDVKNHIFGYTVGNDFTERRFQRRYGQWFKGKSFDTSLALGPCIVTADEIAYPPALDIKCWVNDELRQHDRTDNILFDIDTLISELSLGLTLLPGDLIMTGTPAGVGLGFDPHRFLQPGDKVTTCIQGIGSIINYVR